MTLESQTAQEFSDLTASQLVEESIKRGEGILAEHRCTAGYDRQTHGPLPGRPVYRQGAEHRGQHQLGPGKPPLRKCEI